MQTQNMMFDQVLCSNGESRLLAVASSRAVVNRKPRRQDRHLGLDIGLQFVLSLGFFW